MTGKRKNHKESKEKSLSPKSEEKGETIKTTRKAKVVF